MYIFPDMIELGLKENQNFPNDDYKVVAQNIGLMNPNIKTRDELTDVVQAVLNVPEDRIRSVTYNELVEEFNLPDVYLYEH